MNKVWPWIIGIAVGLIIIAMLFFGASNRQAYWVAKGDVPRVVQVVRTENITLVRFPCGIRAGSIQNSQGMRLLRLEEVIGLPNLERRVPGAARSDYFEHSEIARGHSLWYGR